MDLRLDRISAGLGLVLVVAACAQPAAVTAPMMGPEPLFNKFGEGSCEAGYTYVPGTAPQPPQCVPDDCQISYDAAGAPNILCAPVPQREGGRDPQGSSTTGRTPGQSSTPSTAPGAAP